MRAAEGTLADFESSRPLEPSSPKGFFRRKFCKRNVPCSLAKRPGEAPLSPRQMGRGIRGSPSSQMPQVWGLSPAAGASRWSRGRAVAGWDLLLFFESRLGSDNLSDWFLELKVPSEFSGRCWSLYATSPLSFQCSEGWSLRVPSHEWNIRGSS